MADMGERPTGLTIERINNDGDDEQPIIAAGNAERTGC